MRRQENRRDVALTFGWITGLTNCFVAIALLMPVGGLQTEHRNIAGTPLELVALFLLATGAGLIFIIVRRQRRTGKLAELATLVTKIADSRDFSLRYHQHTDPGRVGANLASAVNRLLDQVETQLAGLYKQMEQRSNELDKLNKEFRHSAFHDSLTGLPNRALLPEYFHITAEAASRETSRFCLLLLDLDNFKVINDALGHDFGDELLVQIASRIQNSIRRGDAVFRLGGDEFAILASGIRDDKDVAAVARQVLGVFKQDFLVQDQPIKVTVSIGGAIFPDHGEDLVCLKRNADIAMYRAKEDGKNRLEVFQATMRAAPVQRLIVQNDLRGAISNRELIPYFQPKIDAQRSRVTGCEVLVRWRHPKHGFLGPAQFVPFAEENGLVRVMDHYILEQACRRARRWQDECGYSIPVAVNLSGVHFRDRQIVEVVGAVLAREGLNPKLLDIELTEAVFIGDPAVALETLTDLKRLGVSVSLDDFGIGYSSLHYLRTLPVDMVKLDKSFIQNLTVSQQDRQLTRGIISLASELGFEVVAEGVETQEQVDALLELNCALMQGYHFCKPCPEEEFLAWIGNKQVHGFEAIHIDKE